jgi:hypothetical protein
MKARLCSIALALITALAAQTAMAQSTAAGTWSIEPSDTAGKVRFDVRTDGSGEGYHNESSSDVETQSLGLSSQQLSSGGNHVTFTLAREAGSFACEGWISNGKGGGTYVFTASSTYLSKMHDLGYDDISARKQMTAAMIDLTTGYVDSIAKAGYPHLPFDKLVAFRALKIDETFVRSMRSLFGNSGVDSEQIVALRALGVTGTYVEQMRAAGFAVPTARDAVQLRALHVDSAYVRELAAAGYSHLSSEQLIQLRALHIDAAYIKRVQAHGFPNPTVEQLVRLKAMNVI